VDGQVGCFEETRKTVGKDEGARGLFFSFFLLGSGKGSECVGLKERNSQTKDLRLWLQGKGALLCFGGDTGEEGEHSRVQGEKMEIHHTALYLTSE
jgi:hypothetical protein